MLGIENYFTFLAAAILLNLYPGPDSLYIMGRSVSQGKSAGFFAALGIGAGSLFHTFVGAIGLSSVLQVSANAFALIKYAGAAYLLYQALAMFKDSFRDSLTTIHFTHQKNSHFKIFQQGALTNILNPKVALFFLALLPQFISPESSNKFFAFILLGLTFITTGTLWCLMLALFSAFFSKRLRRNNR